MEKRVVLLVILCVVVFVGWSMLMKALYPPAPYVPQPPPTTPPTPKPADLTAAPGPKEARQADEPEQITKLANDRVELLLTNRGAGIQSATVLFPDPKHHMHLLRPSGGGIPHLGLTVEGADDNTASGGWTVTPGAPGQSVTYQFKLRNGLNLEKTLELKPGRIDVEMIVRVSKGEAPGPTTVRLRLHTLRELAHDSDYRYDYYGLGFVSTIHMGSRTTESVAYDAPAPRPRFEGDRDPPVVHRVEIPKEERTTRMIEWFGLRNRYAAVALVSRSEVPTGEDRGWFRSVDFHPHKQKSQDQSRDLKGLSVDALFRDIVVADAPHRADFALVLAPIRAEDLKAIPDGKSFLLSYGCWGLFNPIGEVILWFLGAVYSVFGNYGWAIILTTVVVRLALFPLTKKSQTSMARMAELQPKLNALREKYGDDPAKNQAETMKLFKEHGVNPLSGCLPIMAQLPVFIGLYSVLDISLEFRQSPFIGWILDLSQPDRLIPFKQPLNLWITSISDFNIVPIVMTVTWFLQAYYAPRPQDPKLVPQQRMMMFMPVVFGLLCYSLASGLSLYLFVNSLLAMIEQKIIKRYFLPAKAAAAPPAKA